jgi:hypothetical protein
MSQSEEIIDGTLEPDGTLRLSHSPQLPPGPVRVTIKTTTLAAPALPRRTIADVIRQIRAGQIARGFQGWTAEDLARWEAERAMEDEERDRELDAARRPADQGGP